jgi:hypothetical protein
VKCVVIFSTDRVNMIECYILHTDIIYVLCVPLILADYVQMHHKLDIQLIVPVYKTEERGVYNLEQADL